MKPLILTLLAVLCCTCCNAREDKEIAAMEITEKFDVQCYKNIIEGKNSYKGATSTQHTEGNGTETYVSFSDDGSVLQGIEPSIYEVIVRNYYKNCIVKSKGKLLCHLSVKTGIWRKYGNQGNLIKETDENEKLEELRLKPINALRWLEHEGYIDRKAGRGQEKSLKEGSESSIDVYLWLSTRAEGSKTISAGWSIDITEHGMRTTCSFDAGTGEYLGKATQALYE